MTKPMGKREQARREKLKKELKQLVKDEKKYEDYIRVSRSNISGMSYDDEDMATEADSLRSDAEQLEKIHERMEEIDDLLHPKEPA